MGNDVVITGVGLLTPLGRSPDDVLGRVRRGDVAATRPDFNTAGFACSLCAPVAGFDAEEDFPENKTLRMMNRDAQMAVVAARLAMRDAGVVAGETYPAERIALYGATGLTSISTEDVARITQLAAADDGSLDLQRFGHVALKRTRPVLSFKILANMPVCFVSIFESIRGPNAVYAPWEGQGAEAIAAGIRAVQRGEVPCALVGGCDVKTRLLSFVSLAQQGALASWSRDGQGPVPGEGAAFLVLENAQTAAARGARILARIGDFAVRRPGQEANRGEAFANLLSSFTSVEDPTLVSAGNGDPRVDTVEQYALEQVAWPPQDVLRPKAHVGDLFAAAAAVQVALAAAMVASDGHASLAVANCLGFGDHQAAFVLEAV